ncbi:unnamed protein product, partial [Prorocentrum cordatum]
MAAGGEASGGGDAERREALMQMLHANGIKEEDTQRPERVTEIEMVMDDYCCMKALGYFVNLRSVCLIQQAITRLEGVDACPNLERLQLNENQIERIEGLQNCRRLKKLYLCTNSIDEIGDGLNGLDQLEVLWIAENRLTSLLGVGSATSLTELNAARNAIRSVSGALSGNAKLKTLNLADNRVSSFREVPRLARLGRLTDLAFRDPDWGENPICGFSNYATYTLYHLPGLTVHDRMRVGPEEHQGAEAAFSKKRLYYSMRIKLLRRQASDCLRRARALDEELRQQPIGEMESAVLVLKRRDAHTQAGLLNPPMAHVPEAATAGEGADRQRWESVLQGALAKLSAGEAALEALAKNVEDTQRALVQSLLLELQTGGNVRLENGSRQRDAWVQSMEELVRARFRSEDFAGYGISDVKVHCVARVYNRSLRVRMDELFAEADAEDADRQLDYLFYVPPPGCPGESASSALAHLHAVAEEGLEAAERGPALLTSSLLEAAQLEARCATRSAATPGCGAAGAAVPSSCTMLVCSACVAEQQAVSGGAGASKSVRVSRADAVMPEFLVDLDFHMASAAAPEREPCFGPFAGLLRDYAFLVGVGAHAGQAEPGARDEDAVPPRPDRIESLDGTSLLSSGGALPPDLDAHTLGRIQVLDLHGRGIRRIARGVLGPLGSLRTLLLAFNSLETLIGVESQTVTQLDVSFNLIQSVSALPGLPGLLQLDLSWNSLLSTDVVGVLARDAPALEALGLAGNPVLKAPGIRAMILEQLGCLAFLDQQPVSEEAAPAARGPRDPAGVPSEATLAERCFTLSPGEAPGGPPPRLPLAFPMTTSFGEDCSRVLPLLAVEGDQQGPLTWASWRQHVDYMDLRGLGVTAMPRDLAAFGRLRCLDISDSGLGTLECLAPLRWLEELTAERAMLTSAKGASELGQLRKLDLASNQIGEVMELQPLQHLSQLSLEDNSVDSLDTFASLAGVSELYLSNNLIEEPRAVLLLKQVPTLIVLDLAGNELCSAPDYRCYTLFHLRKVKVLDGVPVTPAELAEAEDQFSGRVTMEFLEDRLGPTASCYNLRAVDLSNCRLRELSLLGDELFPALRELNLDGNPFSDLRPVGPLSKLLVLRANRTKLDLGKASASGDGPVGGVASFPHLQVLQAGSCGISDLAPLAKLPLRSLRMLHLPGNEIVRVEGLSALEQLRELVLDGNKIRQFDEQSFEGLKALRELRAENNGLKSLNNLGPLERLRALYLGTNRVAELGELEKLSDLRHLLMVQLAQNPVSRKPLYRSHVICALGSVRAVDGKEVTEEERERAEYVLQMGDASKHPGVVKPRGPQGEPPQVPRLPPSPHHQRAGAGAVSGPRVRGLWTRTARARGFVARAVTVYQPRTYPYP